MYAIHAFPKHWELHPLGVYSQCGQYTTVKKDDCYYQLIRRNMSYYLSSIEHPDYFAWMIRAAIKQAQDYSMPFLLYISRLLHSSTLKNKKRHQSVVDVTDADPWPL